MSIRVLLVDDEVGFVETLAKRLTRRSFDVLTAGGAVEALEILAREPVEVCVLDVRMPGMDGVEATREIRSRHPSVEVILLTGHASIEASQEGLTVGAFDYILKPISLDELVYKIEDAYRQRELSQTRTGQQKPVADGDSTPDGD